MDTSEVDIERRAPAVLVKDLYKGYGSGKSKLNVLQGLDMVVPTGATYGLLGPSGCGKTTLLRCILGRLRIDSGSITALGVKPGTLGHGVPGAMVGYMPQETALFPLLTIGETLFYFGRLFKMKRSRIEERIRFLVDFLGLPEQSRVIGKTSGGQMRRTSFAIALLQEPDLLILDEPTVGVDPLLRQRIWEHLLTIASKGNVTIIITTHYIEEARQAHVVGLMRNGRLLAESGPNRLLEYYQEQSLEDVFLNLCKQDQIEEGVDNTAPQGPRRRNYSQHRKDHGREAEESESLLVPRSTKPKGLSCGNKCWEYMPSGWRILALCIKNFTNLLRNIPFLLFEFFLPTIQVILFCLCIGRQPYGLQMAVVNNETVPIASKLFLQHINPDTIKQINYTEMTDAIKSVQSGYNWGIISFGENFTEDLRKRYSSETEISNDTISGSSVHLYMDNTNQQISLTIQQMIFTAFQDFAREMLQFLGKNPLAADSPIILEHPIYGDLSPSFTNFMAPGIIISITYFMATGLTALAFVIEKKQGLLDRSFVAGVSAVEVMTAHVLTQLVIMVVQVALMLTFALAVFKVPYEGPLVLVVILTLFVGFSGMALGLLISAVCEDENNAIMMSLGTVYPNLILSGIIWPWESMPVVLQYISICMPLTYPSQALRSILSRGWDLTYLEVWRGFLVSIGWGWGLMALAGLVLTLRRI